MASPSPSSSPSPSQDPVAESEPPASMAPKDSNPPPPLPPPPTLPSDPHVIPPSTSVPSQPPVPSDTIPALHENCDAVAPGELDLDQDKKPDTAHKKRTKNWSMPETLLLIRLRTEMATRSAAAGRKLHLWKAVAEGLQREHFPRDAQHCKYRWKKLMVRYKEVRRGHKDKRDNPYYDGLHFFVSLKSRRELKEGREGHKDKSENPYREKENNPFGYENGPDVGVQLPITDYKRDITLNGAEKEGAPRTYTGKEGIGAGEGGVQGVRTPARKRKKGRKFVSLTDVHAMQTLLDTVISRQQRFFMDLLETMERKEQVREQMRQEREEKWRAEERAQRYIFNNAMMVLTQELVGDRIGTW